MADCSAAQSYALVFFYAVVAGILSSALSRLLCPDWDCYDMGMADGCFVPLAVHAFLFAVGYSIMIRRDEDGS